MNQAGLRILIAFPHALHRTGGMEKACISLANAMHRRGHAVRIGCVYGELAPLFYPLEEGVELASFMESCGRAFPSPRLGRCLTPWEKVVREMLRPFSRKRAAAWNERCEARLIQAGIRRELQQFRPDAIVSFQPNMTYYLRYAAGNVVPTITSFRFNADHLMQKAAAPEIRSLNASDAIHVLLPSYAEAFPRYGVSTRVRYIPNAIPQCSEPAELDAPRAVHRIVDAARLNREQKRQHLLVEAFARLADEFPDWQVELWGDDAHYAGGYTGEILRFIRDRHLEERVRICGKTHDVESVYRQADIFCIPSSYEGFSNALGEAMSAGLPAVGYASCPGVNEVIQDGVTGLLAEDGVEALAASLRRLMENQELRVRMGRAARGAMEKFAPDRVWGEWESFLQETARAHGTVSRQENGVGK